MPLHKTPSALRAGNRAPRRTGLRLSPSFGSLAAVPAMTVPEHLASTHRMLVTAFPNGVAGEEYFATIALLYDHMSDRCLAEVMTLAFGRFEAKFPIVYNDIAKVASAAVIPPLDVVAGFVRG